GAAHRAVIGDALIKERRDFAAEIALVLDDAVQIDPPPRGARDLPRARAAPPRAAPPPADPHRSRVPPPHPRRREIQRPALAPAGGLSGPGRGRPGPAPGGARARAAGDSVLHRPGPGLLRPRSRAVP